MGETVGVFCGNVIRRGQQRVGGTVGSVWAIILPIVVQGLTALLANRCKLNPDPAPAPTPAEAREALENALEKNERRTRLIVRREAVDKYKAESGHRPPHNELDAMTDALIDQTLAEDDATFEAVYSACCG